jgi:hypothetical protein
MTELLPIFESGQYQKDKNQLEEYYRDKIKSGHDHFAEKIIETMGKLLTIAEENQSLKKML